MAEVSTIMARSFEQPQTVEDPNPCVSLQFESLAQIGRRDPHGEVEHLGPEPYSGGTARQGAEQAAGTRRLGDDARPGEEGPDSLVSPDSSLPLELAERGDRDAAHARQLAQFGLGGEQVARREPTLHDEPFYERDDLLV